MIASDMCYKNYFLLYIDILGTKERLSSYDEESESIRKNGVPDSEIDFDFLPYPLVFLQQLYKSVQKATIRYEIEAELDGEAPLSPRIVVFSDNIAIALEVPDDVVELKNRITYLLRFAGEYQCRTLVSENGWLTRGCLTAGKLFVSNNNLKNKNQKLSEDNCYKFDTNGISISTSMPEDDLNYLFGPAIVRADFIEREVAIYPRIVIDDVPVGDTQKTLCELIQGYQSSLKMQVMLKDNDGQYYLNYLRYGLDPFNPESEDVFFDEVGFSLMKQWESLSQPSQTATSDKIKSKLAWTETYLSNFRDMLK